MMWLKDTLTPPIWSLFFFCFKFGLYDLYPDGSCWPLGERNISVRQNFISTTSCSCHPQTIWVMKQDHSVQCSVNGQVVMRNIKNRKQAYWILPALGEWWTPEKRVFFFLSSPPYLYIFYHVFVLDSFRGWRAIHSKLQNTLLFFFFFSPSLSISLPNSDFLHHYFGRAVQPLWMQTPTCAGEAKAGSSV